jgi:hypothetical protein
MNKEEKVLIAQMEYGSVPIKVDLYLRPPRGFLQCGYINIDYPTKGWQLLRLFSGREFGEVMFEKATAEVWVEYLDENGDYSRYTVGPNGVSMFLPLN